MRSLRLSVKMTLSLALLLAPLVGWGQSEWKWLTGGNLKAVKFIGQKGWIIGDDGNQGIILHTTNGGDNWAIQPHNTGKHYFKGLSFTDSLNGWIVGGWWGMGEPGFILRTRDGGRTFTRDTCPTENHLNGVSFVDTTYGWVTANTDTIFRTRDGGRSWEGYQPDTNRVKYGGIIFLDTLRGWAVSPAGIFWISYTTDGGVTWTSKNDGFINSQGWLDMVDSLHGGTAGLLQTVRTQDGWRTWQASTPGGGAGLYGISFSDTNYGWAVGGDNNAPATVYHTTNGGANWTFDSTLTRNNAFYGVDAVNINTAFVTGSGGSLAKTTNSGNNWTVLRNVDIGARTLNNAFFKDVNQGWAVGTYGAITHTANGGTVWALQNSGTQAFLYGVDVPTLQTGWVCGEGGLVLATTNAGSGWVRQTSNTTMPLFSIDFPDTNTLVGVAVGGYYGPFTERANAGSGAKDDTLPPPPHGTNIPKAPKWKYPWRPEWTQGKASYRVVTRTTNGGQTWLAQESNQTPLYGVSFASRSEGWACGDGGTVISSTDGGATWVPQSTPTSRALYGVKFHDRNRGWAVGDQGVVILTTNGGLTWTQGTNPVSQVLWGVVFVDSAHGFACGNDGVVIESRDGGRTWARDDSIVHANLMGISAVDSQHVWTVGSFGMVLGWREAGQTGIETKGQGDKGTRGKEIALGQSYPNPTREIASFEYELAKAEQVKVRAYNVAGQAVRTLADGMQTAGKHVVTWDGKDRSGKQVGSGTYFYRLEVAGRKATRKMVVVR